MGDQESAGLQYEKNADKKLQGWSIFGQKNEDAAELYEKAGTCYKLAKAWNKAGGVYEKQANCHLKMESKHEAASAYFNAANCYKKMNNQEAIRCLKVSMNLFLEIGRLSMAAKHCKEVAELYQAEENLELAIEYYEKAADLYRGEEVTSTANQCLLKVAEFSAEVEQYPRAIQIFEEVSHDAVNNHLLKYSVRSYLLNAGLCYICSADTVAINNAIERYQDLDPAFSNTRECKFLMDLSAAIDEEDVGKFTDVIKEFDSMTRLDKWKTSLLLRVKNALKDKEVEEDDLT